MFFGCEHQGGGSDPGRAEEVGEGPGYHRKATFQES
jgi:hypothetical protein